MARSGLQRFVGSYWKRSGETIYNPVRTCGLVAFTTKLTAFRGNNTSKSISCEPNGLSQAQP